MSMQTVGIIGGMGPGATLDLFQKIVSLTPASCDQDHLHIIIDNYPQIPDRTAFILGQGANPLPYLLESAQRLEAAGANLLCMSCNTAHHFVEEIREQISIPLVSIIETCAAAIRLKFPAVSTVGLLATRGTFTAKIYHHTLEHAGLSVAPFTDADLDRLMKVIYAVKAGRLSEHIDEFKFCLHQAQAAGAQLLIAGCTEIPLLLPVVSPAIPVIDPTLTLAEQVVRLALCPSPAEACVTKEIPLAIPQG